jgi:hypothetical protein
MKAGRLAVAVGAALLVGLAGTAFAVNDTADQTVTITVEEIAQLSASGSPGTLILSQAGTTPGSLPVAATEATTSLSWTSNVTAGHTRKVTAGLDATFTAGIVLKATLAKPAGSNGASAGQKTLSATAADMLTGVTNENCTSATISFEATLSAIIAPVTDETKTLTWTLTAEE